MSTGGFPGTASLDTPAGPGQAQAGALCPVLANTARSRGRATGAARGRSQGRRQLLPSPRQRRHNGLRAQAAGGLQQGLCRAPCSPPHLPPLKECTLKYMEGLRKVCYIPQRPSTHRPLSPPRWPGSILVLPPQAEGQA